MPRSDGRPRRKSDRGKNHNGSGGLTLQSAALCSPIFREMWQRGAPLNWTEYVQRCGSAPPTLPVDRAAPDD